MSGSEDLEQTARLIEKTGQRVVFAQAAFVTRQRCTRRWNANWPNSALDRMPDYVCAPEGTVHDETIGVIQGMRHLPATFTPGRRLGAGLDETLEKLRTICDEQELALPITERKETAVVD